MTETQRERAREKNDRLERPVRDTAARDAERRQQEEEDVDMDGAEGALGGEIDAEETQPAVDLSAER